MNLIIPFLFLASSNVNDSISDSGSGSDDLVNMTNMSHTTHTHNSDYTEEDLRRDIFANYGKLTILLEIMKTQSIFFME